MAALWAPPKCGTPLDADPLFEGRGGSYFCLQCLEHSVGPVKVDLAWSGHRYLQEPAGSCVGRAGVYPGASRALGRGGKLTCPGSRDLQKHAQVHVQDCLLQYYLQNQTIGNNARLSTLMIL